MGDKAECDLTTGHLLASDLKKKINSLQNSSFLVLLMLSHQCGVVRRDNSVSWDTG